MEVTASRQGRVKEAASKKGANNLPLWLMHQVTAELTGIHKWLREWFGHNSDLSQSPWSHAILKGHQLNAFLFLPVQDQVLSDIQREKEVRQHGYANIPLLWLSARREGEIAGLSFPGWDTSCLGKTKLINKYHFLCSVFQPSSGFH